MAELRIDSDEMALQVGTANGATRRRFVSVHHDAQRGLRIEADEAAFDEWIVGCTDHTEAVATRLGLFEHP